MMVKISVKTMRSPNAQHLKVDIGTRGNHYSDIVKKKCPTPNIDKVRQFH